MMIAAEEPGKGKRGGIGRRTYIPEELMVEILLKLPVRSLLRFKCVCKLWYELILSPRFMGMHNMNNPHQNHKNEITVTCHDTSNDKPHPMSINTVFFRFNNKPVDSTIPIEASTNLEILGCSNGVICLSLSSLVDSRTPWVFKQQGFVLWNPATKLFRQIDPATKLFRQIGCSGTTTNRFFSFCFDPKADSFKLADVVFNSDMNYGFQVRFFTTCNCDESWREKIIQVHFPLSRREIITMRHIASVQQYMYWKFCSDDYRWFILRFDLIDELFQRYELPDYPNDSSSSLRFCGYKDSMVVFVHKLAQRRGFGSSFDRGGAWYSSIDRGGDLCSAFDRGGALCSSFDVYQLNNDPNQYSWDKIMTYEPSLNSMRGLGFSRKDNVKFRRALRFFRKDNVDFVVLTNSQQILYRDSYTNCTGTLLYNPETKKTVEFPLEDRELKLFQYSETFASFN